MFSLDTGSTVSNWATSSLAASDIPSQYGDGKE
jgi:hypothetical protein